jgi:hypothetical protein
MDEKNDPGRRGPMDRIDREVLLAFVFIALLMLLAHFLQPEGQETKSSSGSHTHEKR